MDQEALVSPSAPKATITVHPSSADDVRSDDASAVGGEEDFETASESDSEAPLPPATVPVAKVTTEEEEEDVDDDMVRASDAPNGKGGALGGGEEDIGVSAVAESKDEVLGGGDPSLEDRDVVTDGPDGKDEILGGGSVAGVEENGDSGGGEEDLEENSGVSPVVESKDEVLGGETVPLAEAGTSVPGAEATESKAIDAVADGGEVEKEGVTEVSGSDQPLEAPAAPAAVGSHENNLDEAVVETKDVEGGAKADGDEAAADLDGGVEEPRAVETELVTVEPENVGGREVEQTAVDSELAAVEPENVDGAVVELKVVESELSVVDLENVDGAVVEQKAVESENVDGAVVEPKAVESELSAVDSENVDGAVVEQKALESELSTAEPENIDGAVVEQKAVESKIDAVESDKIDGAVYEPKDEDGQFVSVEENGDGAEEEPKAAGRELFGAVESENVAGSVEEPISIERELGAVEPESMDAAVADAADRSTEMEVNAVPNPYQAPTDSEAKSDDVDSLHILLEDCNRKEKEEELSETLSVPGLNQCPNNSEAKPDSVESLSIPADDSKGEEATEEVSETLTMVENDGTREISGGSLSPVSVDQKLEGDADVLQAVDVDENQGSDEVEEDEEDDGSVPDQPPRVAILDSSETAKQIIKEMEEGSSGTSSISGFGSSRDFQHQVDGQIVSDSDEEVDTDEDGDDKELFDPAALAALLKAAAGASSDGNITITSQDGSRVFSVDRPAGLGNSAPALRPSAPRSTRPNLFSPSELVVSGEPENDMDEEEKKLHEKVDAIRVKFLRLVMRLGHSPEDTVAAQVLYRLGLAEGLRRGRQMARAFTIETAKKKASLLELEGKDDLDFSCNILVLGKTGVGKSATINSIFGEEKSSTNAFLPATTSVREISGVVDGVKIRVLDTPGLKSSVMDQAANGKILSSIKKYMKKCPPDIVLYVDRLDTQTRDQNDFPLLKSITKALGSSVWFNAIVALTHAASAPPEGPNGAPLGYESFISQRSSVVQHSIRQAAGDMRLMNPVALVENHPSCRRNREGQRVLPNGLSWRPQMLLLCYSSKILSEANSLLKLHDPSPSKLFGRFRSPPLPYLLSTLLQSRPHPKLSTDQGGDNGDSDIDLDDFSDEEEEEDEYDQLPPFKPLRKAQITKLTSEQKRAYFDEYDYRVKLLQKKQWKQELRRMKEMKKRGKSGQDESAYDMAEDYDQDGTPAAVPVPLPDMVLPPSFDCDIPTYRYRFLEPTSQLLTRPVLDSHGWDHDCGYDGVSLEESLAIAGKFPAAVAVQITKDKKEFNIHLDSSVSAKHGENGSTLAGFDIQTIHGKLAYILRGESKFKNLKKNRTTAGVSVTFLGETVATGLKVEDQLSIGKRLTLVASTGAMRSQGDVAYGANLEARLKEKDFPIGQALSTLGLSLMKWRSDLALGANLQTQLNVGRSSKVAVRVGLNNKLSGQITVRTSTSDQLQLALVGILPVAVNIFRSIWPGESYLV
ncbi:translocase of chloroplast 159, chloroplastic-like [Iris pallida]|uniref:Translocase of chloroplast 159, chloroplastic-like n=1 Tax=Iris pallida TaxID=29817 RepID=A0AAX6DQK9_IRIPA|nr:translocase of chloroplast 159, chloroplastic-like [Iris pallida]